MLTQYLSDFSFYFRIGWHHIISADALDHQLFILSLVAIYTFHNIRQILILVTAFTIGHSLTLILSVLDVVRFSNHWVEFLIPCTILITALNNLRLAGLKPQTISINYYLALSFGLIHGMGFANSIRIMLAHDQTIGWGLFGFNCGLEVGQIAVVSIILIITAVALNFFKVARRDWVIFLSSATFALSLKMALERLPL
ncbi:HupE / UreJ protein [Mucilaginibacter sp. PPCGB 2223]|uniref:HupE/UreJ family protein n=1 Tax=Mucilaginibacter sp. PPCGB 2223 TaxID=1886027 RepID=UPI000824338F|nr:HupE/UreJ family protein [Mucilaginibacter sp. PPCGB 2223]OCX50806.1 HupE / UreJ protein [Mucilaginibacter sp. PPCGB 2223]